MWPYVLAGAAIGAMVGILTGKPVKKETPPAPEQKPAATETKEVTPPNPPTE